jgi:hypothetical protein
MGMDVIGRAPRSERGKYFENNSSWWHPLATYCKEVAPEIARGCRHWHTNSGDGLDAAASPALAEALEAEIESGRCLDIERQAEAEREAAPKEICPPCHGKGVVWRTRPQPTVNLYGEVEFAPLYITDADDPRIDGRWGRHAVLRLQRPRLSPAIIHQPVQRQERPELRGLPARLRRVRDPVKMPCFACNGRGFHA